MAGSSSPPVRQFLFPAAFLAGLGWMGLLALLFGAIPTVGPRWLFFFFLVMALAGSFLPLAAFLNRRFPSNPPAGVSVVVRQALWPGVYIAGLAWLQIGRALTPALAGLLFVGLVMIEALLRLNERSRTKP